MAPLLMRFCPLKGPSPSSFIFSIRSQGSSFPSVRVNLLFSHVIYINKKLRVSPFVGLASVLLQVQILRNPRQLEPSTQDSSLWTESKHPTAPLVETAKSSISLLFLLLLIVSFFYSFFVIFQNPSKLVPKTHADAPKPGLNSPNQ